MNRICSTLAGEGFDVQLVGRERGNAEKLNSKTYSQKRLKCFFDKGKLFYAEFNIRLFFYLLFQKTDIICAIDLDTLGAAFLASRFKKVKLFYDSHEYFTEVIELAHRPVSRKIWRMLEAFFVPRVEVAYTVSENLRRIFQEKYKVKFHLIRNLPLLEEYTKPEKGEKYIVYAGVVNEGRGLEEMIEAMNYIDCKFIICGHGDLLEQLIEKVHNLGMSEKVKFYGAMKPDELKIIVRKAYLGVLLLRNEGLNYYYSLANKFFDYMHAGIPQVTSDFPEYRIINEKYKVAALIDLNVQAIVKTINKLLSDQEYYDELAGNAVQARKEYNWQKEAETLIQIYKSNG
jgi:glycosyltransferase involved in cell wall biosynthesis